MPTVLITGANRGIGLEFARQYAQAGWRVLALDMRGRGNSDRDPAENYDIATYVADITALLAQLGIGRAIFVGTSMGGLITVELGTLYPELVAGAVIVQCFVASCTAVTVYVVGAPYLADAAFGVMVTPAPTSRGSRACSNTQTRKP